VNKQQRKQRDLIVASFNQYLDADLVSLTNRATMRECIDNARGSLESMQEEEQDKYDNMPESLQGGDKGDQLQTVIDALETAVSALQEALDAIPADGEAGEEGWAQAVADECEQADNSAQEF
jgi:vacuolar-type H+-ATPase subunit E/Vma4